MRGCVQAGVTRPRKEKRRFSTQSPSFGLPWEVSHSLVFTYEHEMSSKRERVSVQNHCYRPPRVPAPGCQQQRAQLPFQVTSSATTYHRPVLNTRFAPESTCGRRAPRAPATRTRTCTSSPQGPQAARSHHKVPAGWGATLSFPAQHFSGLTRERGTVSSCTQREGFERHLLWL